MVPRWRFADRLAQAALQSPHLPVMASGETTGIVSVEDANSRAYGLHLMRNSASAALRVSTARGQLSCWRRAIPDLPDDYLDGVDTLEAFQDQMIAQLNDDQAAIAPHIARLNDHQPSRTCWARPVPAGAHRGTWTGRDPWVTHAHDYLTTIMQGPSMAISAPNLRAILQAMVSLVSATDRGLTASHRTIAELARREHGCTLALGTATQRVRTIRWRLERGGFHRTHVVGGHLNSLERLSGQTLDFYLSPKRNVAAAKRFLAKALRANTSAGYPQVISTGKAPSLARAISSVEGRRHLPIDGRASSGEIPRAMW